MWVDWVSREAADHEVEHEKEASVRFSALRVRIASDGCRCGGSTWGDTSGEHTRLEISTQEQVTAPVQQQTQTQSRFFCTRLLHTPPAHACSDFYAHERMGHRRRQRSRNIHPSPVFIMFASARLWLRSVRSEKPIRHGRSTLRRLPGDAVLPRLNVPGENPFPLSHHAALGARINSHTTLLPTQPTRV